jgi:hypothetical protein
MAGIVKHIGVISKMRFHSKKMLLSFISAKTACYSMILSGSSQVLYNIHTIYIQGLRYPEPKSRLSCGPRAEHPPPARYQPGPLSGLRRASRVIDEHLIQGFSPSK